MIRPHEDTAIAQGVSIGRIKRRQLLRIGFLTGTILAVGEVLGILPVFIRVIKIEGLGAIVTAGKKADVLSQWKTTNDTPILNIEGRFFLIHGPSAIAAAYRKCTHLGCAVPWNAAEDQFHCPCHGSLYDKHTALKKGGPAPRGLDLFHISEKNGALLVDTNPLKVMQRPDNQWHPDQVEVHDT